MMVAPLPSRTRVRPTTSMSSPYQRCQKPWLRTTWPGPSAEDSSMVKVPPRKGWMPKVVKRLGVM